MSFVLDGSPRRAARSPAVFLTTPLNMKTSRLICAAAACAAIFLTGCSGRTADNMVPTGETVHVVIPTDDVAQDSAIANGEEINLIDQPATPDRK